MLDEPSSLAEHDAAWWFARLRADNVRPRERARFTRWLNADPANAAAYAACEELWNELQEAAADEGVLALREQALALAPRRPAVRWESLGAIAATLAIALIAGLLLLRFDRPAGPGAPEADPASIARLDSPRTYSTEIGQRSTVTLADGSTVELNTASVMQVNFSAGRRDVRLLRGQALFEVARDPARPFTVEAGGRRVTALGTRFDVRLDNDGVQVTLIEGEVAVARGDAPADGGSVEAAVRLRPGEQLIAAAEAPPVVRPADVERAVSWRTGRIAFTDEPLAEVIEEINRYSVRKVVLGDPTIASLRVSGVFRTGSVGGFVSALDTAFPVASRLDESSNTIVLTWQ